MSDLEAIVRRLASWPDGEDDYRAKLEQVERAAELPGGLAALTRLVTSSRRDLVSQVAFVLAREAPSVTPATSGLVYTLAGALDEHAEDATISNCVTAIHRQAMYDHPWPKEAAPSDVMYPLVTRALTLGVQSSSCDSAFGLLNRLYRDGRFPEVFTDAQIARIHARLVELARQVSDPIVLSGLEQFLADGKPRMS